MGKDHLGYPSGVNKSEGTGNSAAGDDNKNKEATDKYTKSEDEVAENIPERHPNRNRDKNDATNAGGYKQ
jgi:hypothetical protein